MDEEGDKNMKHKLARIEIEKYAIENKEFATTEVFEHLLNMKKSYQVTPKELINILGRSKHYSLIEEGEWIWNDRKNKRIVE